MCQVVRHALKRPKVGERTMLACIGLHQRECLVEDTATGLHRPRNYMQSLESRVVYLGSFLRESRPDISLDGDDQSRTMNNESVVPFVPPTSAQMPGVSTFGQDSPERAYTGSSHTHQASSTLQNEHAGQVDHLSSEVAMLCLNAAGGEPQYFGPSSAVSFSRIISATMGLKSDPNLSTPRTADLDESDPRVPRTDRVPQLPPPSVSVNLTRAYFDNIHPQYPFLHRPTFCKWEQEVRNASESVDNSTAGEIPIFFVLMAYATGSLVMSQSQDYTASTYYNMALDHLPAVLALNNLESVQSILCCAVYSIRSPTGPSLWKISGMAIRHCIELGYHRSADKYRKHIDPLTKELSTRCFWVAYDIDRVAAFILGRPVAIPEELIDAELPLDIEDEKITRDSLLEKPRATDDQLPTIMTGTIHVIALRKLWAKIHATLYSPNLQHPSTTSEFAIVEGLRQELEDWHASAPIHLDYTATHPLSVFASN
ncbi:transcriptional regulator family: Fungal Specific TF [Penicillium vulpinum]|uniref:transcriptional regulator family: Fungal Specific TF n=1 Tax=Penicillium vulpinum TaxID=29845 RepID=UPI0025471560|nr:transcriptional regulator family: Fungal Specific TF [Penicillium vulpinum]KAJ5958927.1 transcriptional regulator family: Fungal Specific TF [Penicillium vulpinum]